MINLDRVMDAIESDEYLGVCIACGMEHDGIEPDARNYTCEACGANQVFGMEELLIMGGSI